MIYNLLLRLLDRHGRDDGEAADQTIKIEIRLTIQANEIYGVLRLAGTGRFGIRIEQKANIGPGNQPHDEANVGAYEWILQIEIGQLVVCVTVEDDQLGIPLQGVLEDSSCRDRIHEIEKHPNASHREAAHVLVAAIDGGVRPSNSLFSFKYPVTCSLADICELGDVVPETKDLVTDTLVSQEDAQVINLSGLPGAIDARKAYRSNSR